MKTLVAPLESRTMSTAHASFPDMPAQERHCWQSAVVMPVPGHCAEFANTRTHAFGNVMAESSHAESRCIVRGDAIVDDVYFSDKRRGRV
jgi:hypothetical protein